MAITKERVDRLEEALIEFISIHKKTEIGLREFKEEMKAFKKEMADYKDWSQKSIENLNQRWGNLAHKMGTMVEDIFAPSIDSEKTHHHSHLYPRSGRLHPDRSVRRTHHQ